MAAAVRGVRVGGRSSSRISRARRTMTQLTQTATPQGASYKKSCSFNKRGQFVCTESRKKIRPSRHVHVHICKAKVFIAPIINVCVVIFLHGVD